MGPAFTGVTGQVRGVAVSADSQRIVTIDGAKNLYVHTLASGGAPVTAALGVYPLSLSLEAGSSATNIIAAVGFDTGRAATFQYTGCTITALSAFTVQTSTSIYVTVCRVRAHRHAAGHGGRLGRAAILVQPRQQRHVRAARR